MRGTSDAGYGVRHAVYRLWFRLKKMPFRIYLEDGCEDGLGSRMGRLGWALGGEGEEGTL